MLLVLPVGLVLLVGVLCGNGVVVEPLVAPQLMHLVLARRFAEANNYEEKEEEHE